MKQWKWLVKIIIQIGKENRGEKIISMEKSSPKEDK
jgi:hypothetical protein